MPLCTCLIYGSTKKTFWNAFMHILYKYLVSINGFLVNKTVKFQFQFKYRNKDCAPRMSMRKRRWCLSLTYGWTAKNSQLNEAISDMYIGKSWI